MTQAERDEELRRQSAQLELAVGAASRLPQRPAGELRYPPFRTLVAR